MRFRGNPWLMPGWERQLIIPVCKRITKGLPKSSHQPHASQISKWLHSHTWPVLTRTLSVQTTQRVLSECVQNRGGWAQGYTCGLSTGKLREPSGLRGADSVLTVAGTVFLSLCSCLCPVNLYSYPPSTSNLYPPLKSTEINTTHVFFLSLCLLNANIQLPFKPYSASEGMRIYSRELENVVLCPPIICDFYECYCFQQNQKMQKWKCWPSCLLSFCVFKSVEKRKSVHKRNRTA